jgi:hypothetical protein
MHTVNGRAASRKAAPVVKSVRSTADNTNTESEHQGETAPSAAAGPSETREFAAELNTASARREGDFEPSPHRVSEIGSPDLGPKQDDIIRLRYRLLKMSKHTRANRVRAYHELMRSGWSQVLLDEELDAALRWACSTVRAAEQRAQIKKRAMDRARISDDAGLENMFASVGVDRENIIKDEETGGRDAPF